MYCVALHLCLLQVHVCLLNTSRGLLVFCSVPSQSPGIPKGFFINIVIGGNESSCVYCLLLNKWLSVLTQVLFVFWLLTFSCVPSCLIWAEDSCLCDSMIHHVRELTQLPITLKLEKKKKTNPVLFWSSSALFSCLVC